MGLFGFNKRQAKNETPHPGKDFLGPTCLEGYTATIRNSGSKAGQWQARLVTPDGQQRFKIRYYGQLHEKHKELIVGTSSAPALVFAVHPITGEMVMLFDGRKHGYNALFCDVYPVGTLETRHAETFYADKNGDDTFEITVTTYNNIDYEEEFSDQIDENGSVELIDGSKMDLDMVKRDGYGAISISATGENGQRFEILSEELA